MLVIKVDLHVHSNYSKDAYTSVKDLAIAARLRGLDAIGICDHNALPKVEEGLPVLVLAGTEVSTSDGHLIVFGLNYVPKKGTSAVETAEKAMQEGGIVIVPHAFKNRDSLGEKAFKIPRHKIEKFNAHSLKHNIISLAKGLKGISSSDAHYPQDLGMGLTIFDCEKNRESLFEAIRKQDGRPVLKPVAIFSRPIRMYRRLIDKLKKKDVGGELG